MFTREQMKQAAKISLKKNWGDAVVAVLLSALPSTIISIISNIFTRYQSGGMPYSFSEYSEEFTLPEPTPFSIIINIISALVAIFITPVLMVGVSRFFLKTRGNLQPNGTEAFAPFKESSCGNIIFVNFIVGLNLVFWYILLIVPGIIKSLQYAMVNPLLASNPQLSSSRAKAISKEMMKGHCGEYFVLLLSFFGWYILSAFTFGISYIVYVGPYFNATVIEFFSCRRAELILKGELDPAEVPSYGTDWYSPYNNNGPFTSSGITSGFNQGGFNPNPDGYNQGFANPAGMPFPGNSQSIAQGFGTPPLNPTPMQSSAPMQFNNQNEQFIKNNATDIALHTPLSDNVGHNQQSAPAENAPVSEDTHTDGENNTEIQ